MNEKPSILDSDRLLQPQEVMEFFGHKDRGSFRQFCQANGVPFITLGPRRHVFDPKALRAFLDSRTVGRVDRRAA